MESPHEQGLVFLFASTESTFLVLVPPEKRVRGGSSKVKYRRNKTAGDALTLLNI